ncbi:hypothetical protein TcCL_NonESM04374 [Trypanosoma cruzi]|nr:hypothetical protein TcCL_NonESM04374 [Trypanosoma cruzi]
MHVCLPCGFGVMDLYFTLFGAAEVDGEVMLSRAARAWWKRLREPVKDPSKSKVYHAVWVYKEGRNSGRLRGVAMHAAAEDDMRCWVHVECHFGCFFSRP